VSWLGGGWVVTIAPGLFITPMVDGLPACVQASLAAGVPTAAARPPVGIRRPGGAHRHQRLLNGG